MTQASCWFRFWMQVCFFRDKLSIRKDNFFSWMKLNQVIFHVSSFKKVENEFWQNHWNFDFPLYFLFERVPHNREFYFIPTSCSIEYISFIVKHVFFIRFIFILAMFFLSFSVSAFVFEKQKKCAVVTHMLGQFLLECVLYK